MDQYQASNILRKNLTLFSMAQKIDNDFHFQLHKTIFPF
ncbi:hypothetical protein B4087_2439 [Bacillus cereus]|nr:hypothetical protein B4087_2439 [Bacillus cereus]